MTPFHDADVRGLRIAHFNQLMSCIEWVDHSGENFPSNKSFNKRHEDLRRWVKGMIDAKMLER